MDDSAHCGGSDSFGGSPAFPTPMCVLAGVHCVPTPSLIVSVALFLRLGLLLCGLGCCLGWFQGDPRKPCPHGVSGAS